MRVAPLLTLAAALSLGAVGAAEAQTASSTAAQPAVQAQAQSQAPVTGQAKPQKKRQVVVITKRSPLDAGTVVKPGSKSYLDYALPAGYNFPTYGAGESGIVPGRYPLPDRFYLPGY